MKLKDSYTLEELCSGLSITLKKFCQMAGITEGTLINLRQGHAGRLSSINSVLNTFSQVYGIDFSLENVSGLTVQEKPHQKGKKPPAQVETINVTPEPENRQISIVEPKRPYTKQKEKKSTLPDGCILASDFAKIHGVNPRTFIDHMIIGKGPGTVPGEETHPTLGVKDHVDHSLRDKPGRSGRGEKEKYLTQEQQQKALAFWKRHDVVYTHCDQDACPCKKGELN